MTQTAQLTKAEAAAHVGVSVRTLLRLTGKEIAHLPKRRPSDETLYDRAELDRYLRELEAGAGKIVGAAVVTPGTHDTPAENQALARRNGGVTLSPVILGAGDALDTPEMRDRMIAAFEMMASPVRLADKLTLSLTEASLLAGLSRNHLREAIGAGKLKAKIIGRGWKVRRAELEGYTAKLLK
jgi:excisionase family DNA binding protein